MPVAAKRPITLPSGSMPRFSINTCREREVTKGKDIETRKLGLEGLEVSQVRVTWRWWRWLRIRSLLKLIERPSPAIVECILVTGIKIDQSSDASGVST